jgi:hypothetical protein
MICGPDTFCGRAGIVDEQGQVKYQRQSHVVTTFLYYVVYTRLHTHEISRVKAEGRSFHHCVSRVADRQSIFLTTGHGSPEAERFVLLMRRLEAFSGVRF